MFSYDKSTYQHDENVDSEKAKQNKPKVAFALSYNPGDEAPTVIASGKGTLAERII